MVGAWGWQFLTLGFNPRPGLPIKVEIEQVVEVVASFALVTTEEVKAIHIGDSSGTRPLRWLVTDRVDFAPAVLSN